MDTTRLRLLLLAVFLVSVVASFASADVYVTILHFNDFHGYLQPVGPPDASVGGLARIATAAREVRAWNDDHDNDTLFFEAGDILQGTPLSMFYQGAPDVCCLNLMDLDAMCIGNHEFDYGQDNLQRLVTLAQFPILSANIYVRDTDQRLAPAYYLFTLRDGTRGAVFGLTSRDTPVETLPSNVKGLEFTDPLAEAKKVLAELPADVTFLIALSHIGYENDVPLAEACPELDVIVGAHSHTKLERPTRVGKTLIVQAESYGKYLGQLDMLVSQGEVVRYRGFLRAINQTIPEAPDVAAIVEAHAARLESTLREPVGVAAVDLQGERDIVRSSETNLANLVCDLYREYARAEICLINAGAVRASLPAGPITVGDVLKVAPFGNKLAVKDVTGDQLWRALERAASLERPAGGFPQVSGMALVIEGQTLREVKIAGEPLDRQRTYRLVSSEFLLAGGDGYAALKEGAEATPLELLDNEAIIAQWRLRGTVSPRVEGRIVIR